MSQKLGNIRSALEWSFGSDGDVMIAVPLAAASAAVFLNLSLLVECRAWCARALERLPESHRDTAIELELHAARGLSLMFTRGNSEAAEASLRRALDVAVALGDQWNQLRLLGRLHIFHERIGDYATARAWAAMAVEVAAEIGEPEAIAIAASLSGISHHLSGDQLTARRELEVALSHSLPPDRRRTIRYGFDHRNRSGIALARALWLLGFADRARDVAAATVEEAAGLEHPITHCIALVWTFSIHYWRGDLEDAEEGLATFAECADVNAFGPYNAAAPGFRGKLAIREGRPAQAVAWIEESLARLHAARYELLTTSFSISLTQALALCGRHHEALELVNATIDRCRGNGEGLAMPELLRIKAEVSRSISDVDPAELGALLLESLELSRRQGARSWELRAATTLAGYWMDHDRPAEALELLRPVRAEFSEGFDTVDLRTADALLQSLSKLNTRSLA